MKPLFPSPSKAFLITSSLSATTPLKFNTPNKLIQNIKPGTLSAAVL
jgi:hypothetical protein